MTESGRGQNHHQGACIEQHFRDGAADSAGATSDQTDFVFQYFRILHAFQDTSAGVPTILARRLRDVERNRLS